MSVIGQEAGIEHGTMRGYRQHIYRQVMACEPCLQALRVQQSGRRTAAEKRAGRRVAEHNEVRFKAPAVQRPLATRPPGTIAGRDLAVGDVIVFLGREYPVDRFEPYTGSLHAELGEGARTACSGTWEMAIGPNATIRILPRTEASS